MVPILIGGIVVLLLAALFVVAVCIRKIQPGKAGIIVGIGGMRVGFDYMIRVPIFQTMELVDISVKKLEIHRKAKDGLVCKDNIRADISVAFYIRVDATPESVRKVAQMLTPERVSDIVQLRELFEAKFSEALKTAGRSRESRRPRFAPPNHVGFTNRRRSACLPLGGARGEGETGRSLVGCDSPPPAPCKKPVCAPGTGHEIALAPSASRSNSHSATSSCNCARGGIGRRARFRF